MVFTSILKKANDLNWCFEKEIITGFCVSPSVLDSAVIFMPPQQFFLKGKIFRAKKIIFLSSLPQKFKIFSNKWKHRNHLFLSWLQTCQTLRHVVSLDFLPLRTLVGQNNNKGKWKSLFSPTAWPAVLWAGASGPAVHHGRQFLG